MRIAIIGSGISGLVAARRLSASHEICVFEAADYIGGHTKTIDVELGNERHAVDTGFIVFNDRTYPNFVRLMNELGVASQAASMSFSVRCERTGLEYRGAHPSGLFAQRRNLVNWRFYRLMADWLRFNRRAAAFLQGDKQFTVRDFLDRERFSREFIEQYFLPMGSAVWSCPRDTFQEFPIRFILEFYRNHGLLSIRGRPQWNVIAGGSRSYVAPLIRPFCQRIRLSTPVLGIERGEHSVHLRLPAGEIQPFDHVVFACHSDQALRILGDAATPLERETLSAFPYEPNNVVLHTDTALLPKTRSAWAAWNYLVPREDLGKATVTYNMNLLQGLTARKTYCVTLNGSERIDPEKILRCFVYHHPTFTLARSAAQARHRDLLVANRTSFCGAYWGNGFHEDGVNSALAVAQALAGKEHLWNPASTKAGSSIDAAEACLIGSASGSI